MDQTSHVGAIGGLCMVCETQKKAPHQLPHGQSEPSIEEVLTTDIYFFSVRAALADTTETRPTKTI